MDASPIPSPDAPTWDKHTASPDFFTQPSDCPPITDVDLALLTRTVGDTNAAVLPVRRQKCPACSGRGRVRTLGAESDIKTELCTRCNGGHQHDGCVSSLSLDELTRKHTGFRSFAELCYDPGGLSTYRPSLYVKNSPEVLRLADAYDSVQAARGDSRRCYRG